MLVVPTDYTAKDLSNPQMKQVICSQAEERFLYLRSLKNQVVSGQVDAVAEFGQDFADNLLATNFEHGKMSFAVRTSGQVVLVVVSDE